MPTTPHIRPANRADLPAFKRVINANAMFPPKHLDAMIPAYFDHQDGNDLWLICEDGDDAADPAAVAFCAPERVAEGTWTLYLFAVNPNSQSKGLGAVMLSHIEHQLRARGARVLLVGTSSLARYDRARVFYRANGYNEAARIQDFYSAGEDQIVFRKALSHAAR